MSYMLWAAMTLYGLLAIALKCLTHASNKIGCSRAVSKCCTTWTRRGLLSAMKNSHLSPMPSSRLERPLHGQVHGSLQYNSSGSFRSAAYVAGGRSQYTKSARSRSASPLSNSKNRRRLAKCLPGLDSPGPCRYSSESGYWIFESVELR